MNELLVLRSIFSIIEIMLYTIATILISGASKDDVIKTIFLSIIMAVALSTLVPFMGIVGYAPAMVIMMRSYTLINIKIIIKSTIFTTSIMLICNVLAILFASIINLDLRVFNPCIATLTLVLSTTGYCALIKEKTNAFSLGYWSKRKKRN